MDLLAFVMALQAEGKTAEEVRTAVNQYLEDNPGAINQAAVEALNYATRDILNNQNAGIQRILDQMCQDKIDAKNDEIANLRTQLNMANLAASQGAQTSRILADNAAQTTMLEQYLAPVPRPAYIVQNPNGCGCNQNPCCQ